ncbi:N-acetylmuramoyl-L-alanine amidase family protein (plasmid) [Paenibacillus sp. EC2-1]|uniref:peptidoglycan recognition protein family protein n=1 Tax=Paenibacillus sp. EC2-1 TaxID=3388665 RepID=UPI003BEF118F
MYDEFNIIDWLIPVNKWTRPGTKITPGGLAIHWTGNINFGADAKANANYFHNLNGSYASAPYILDSVRTYRLFPENEMAYHVGSSNGYKTDRFGNYPNDKLIGLEICVNMDGDFKTTYDRAVGFAAAILKRYGWDPKKHMVRHYDVTGKDCPMMMTDYIKDPAHVRASVKSMIKRKKDETDASYEKRIAEGITFMKTLNIGGVTGNALWAKFVADVGAAMSGKKPESIEDKVVYHMGKYFADVDDNSWSGKIVNQAHEMKTANGQSLMGGSTDAKGKLVARPNENITRAETAALMIRAINYAVEQAKK